MQAEVPQRQREAAAPSAQACARDGAAHLIARFITAHADERLTTGEIATACGLTARTMYRRFTRAYRITPMQFLKQQRLQRVRADLLAAVPGTTVTSAAFHRGITHLGRFAREYAVAFGETPSETLRR